MVRTTLPDGRRSGREPFPINCWPAASSVDSFWSATRPKPTPAPPRSKSVMAVLRLTVMELMSRLTIESPLLCLLCRRQPECNQLTAVTGTADRDDDVLLAVDHVRHGRTALGRRHVDGAHLSSCGFVVRAQHRATLARGCGRHARIAAHHQRPGDDRSGIARLSGARNREVLEVGVVLDVVRRFTARHLPQDFAFVLID